MLPVGLVPFLAGFLCALFLGAILKVILGMRLNLYFVSQDPGAKDLNIIPLTSELKKRSWLKTILQKQWEEDLDLMLADYDGGQFQCRIQYHLWRGFYLEPKESTSVALLARKPIQPKKRHFLKTGQDLHVGDRKFTILVTSTPPEKVLSREPHFQLK